jgi:diaminohydroxyphosphoribosylaminopyrimidine deaminase/5-amino-6-(5-phosphoribosylamino)uracil reductase
VIAAGFRRVIIGCADPAEHVAGQGIQKLRDAGVDVTVGICHAEARRLIAPFGKLMLRGMPWVHAKWAMSLDGRIATHTGHSKWISGESSRAWVHTLRGRVDAIITGAGTVRADDPLLTARPPGPRTALRVVVDSTGESLTADTQLIRTAREVPLLVCVCDRSQKATIDRLSRSGVQILNTSGDGRVDLSAVLAELGKRRMTNVLIEAGPALLGGFFDADLVDEIHVFLAPKIIGGQTALSAVGGIGCECVPSLPNLFRLLCQQVGEDILIEGDCDHSSPRNPK